MSQKEVAVRALPGKAVAPDERFAYVMALALNPKSGNEDGLIRVITSREGDVEISGYLDKSELYTVQKNDDQYVIGNRIEIDGEQEIVERLSQGTREFLGCEDPDIVFDADTGIIHLYFTMPFLDRETGRMDVHLGHACGERLDALTMQEPVLNVSAITGASAKEVAIVPQSASGEYFHLIESSAPGELGSYSTVRIAQAQALNGPWRFGKTVIHPKEAGSAWLAGHASPGPVLPKTFVDPGPGKVVCLINGREENRFVKDHIVYGMFSVGLAVYNYELGEMEWIAPEPLIIDSEARTITFASQFVYLDDRISMLYAHVDDAFVRAYELSSEGIRALLPEPFR